MASLPSPDLTAPGSAVVVIPGIGGHPSFHADLIRALQGSVAVLTQPHGDFSAPPWRSLQAHVDHWRDVIERARAPRVVLIGISFGAQIAAALARELGQRLVGLILISWWPIGWPERAALHSLASLPATALQRLLGRWAFYWSERQSDDPDALRRIRAALYDDEASVHARLWARLLCCREGRLTLAPGSPPSVHFVYGTRELAGLRAALIKGRLRAWGELRRVSGDHAVSTRASPAFEQTVLDLVLQTLDTAETVA